ncbi:pathogenesis-related homeodomain protein [Lactuca sativa]|uniref:Pathogenesis-related homeodomain protein n=1 Tax=Lactuca sativa TaxID=4236 RepID=A0A9R1X3B0_LACSA|nr:pathogenesis-related homeodomain protein [Lactuca sativa]XP_023765466.1 pathogenesis-related homeodomain protein [Lactuca sativa]XP_042752204.1 pathogenesis-related homeodomain protein [Lactuca sativa]KAJ0196459.1 hypothetical protein LSAT_V11C700364750 [Lactuca sativa]
MTGVETKETRKNIGKLLHSKCSTQKLHTKRSRKPKTPMSKEKLVEFLTNSKRNDFKCRNASHKTIKSLINPSITTFQNQEETAKCENTDLTSEKLKKRRKRKRTKNKVEVDEASRLQGRTRYLLFKMRKEQNLLDAYSTEGWKGQSREKIKPEKELQRAKKQILKCKLGLRDALRQLDLLSTDGRIDESVIAPDGSIHHDHIHCAKCKLREAFPDNDIILCDGTCNCAFHQMCIDPPLLTENIPPGDQGWFCKYCICKTDIIDAMNAQLGTSYSNDINWQEVFKVEATLPDGGETLLNQEDWPSDDSGDDDYDPERVEKHESSCSNIKLCSEGEGESSDDDGSSNYSFISLDDEILVDDSRELRIPGIEVNSGDFIPGSGSGSGSDFEPVSGRRQRRAVDYRKLYDEMFGKDALANEQVSEDEDWGPTNRKRREKESDAASTLMTLCETEDKMGKDVAEISKNDTDSKRSFFRIPSEAVEKLRLVFAKNELPSRAVKEEISNQLGLDLEKVNKWFKNARYLSLKRKAEDKPTQNDGPSISKESANNEILSENIPTNATKQHDNGDLLVSTSTNMVDCDVIGGTQSDNQESTSAEAHMQKLCYLKTKLENLQNILLVRTPNRRAKTTAAQSSSIDHSSTIFVPIAHLKEKP